jgi:hypothetical protein
MATTTTTTAGGKGGGGGEVERRGGDMEGEGGKEGGEVCLAVLVIVIRIIHRNNTYFTSIYLAVTVVACNLR